MGRPRAGGQGAQGGRSLGLARPLPVDGVGIARPIKDASCAQSHLGLDYAALGTPTIPAVPCSGLWLTRPRARCRTRTDDPRLTRRALPAELSGQFVIRCPAHSHCLVVRRRIKSKIDLRAAGLIDWHSIDPVILGAISDEEVRLSPVVTALRALRVGSDTLTIELHTTARDSRGLALHTDESSPRDRAPGRSGD